MYKSIDVVRQEFLDFFHKQEHQVVPSSSLVPKNDQTLLFTNSGMNQFKDIFLGLVKPSYKRVVTAQRCMRAGGKHNDLNNVGYTECHLTFFEMLGNFSFGDYFKDDAIQFAWELLTDSNWFGLSKDKIWVTTHIEDDESYNIWVKQVGISTKRIVKIGNKNSDLYDSDNFWQMGNIGPCGPCSEIFYDFGSDLKGKPPGYMQGLGSRYIEIWNLVFMQFNRQLNDRLIDLPMLSVDTGMGLERITAILQGVHSNYLIDVFKNLIVDISNIMKVKEYINNRSLYVIADHIRACVFLIKDGVVPSNEGQGYVLRRIIRRSVRHGRKLGVNDIFLYKLVNLVIVHMNYVSNILYDQKDLIEQILFNEEKLFNNTLKKGLELLEKSLKNLNQDKILSGEIAFQLYTTYGFPLELTKDICCERNIKVDQLEFDQIMLTERRNSKRLSQFHKNFNNIILSSYAKTSTFVGYKCFSCQSKIIALLQDNELINKMCDVDQESMVILDITPFYGESGGQIGDSGYLKGECGVFKVKNTKKYGQIIVHIGVLISGIFLIGEQVFAQVNRLKRKDISVNHSSTHLLHSALLKILGSHVTQQGSLINDKYFRFDFSHYNAITITQINEVENLINQQIWDNLLVTENIMLMESARNIGAIMLLHKQYTEKVRVIQIGDCSIELCGGTHVSNTNEIGLFIITKEFGIGSGVRRIEAVTKNAALSVIQNKKKLIQNIAQIAQSDDVNLLNVIHEFKARYEKLDREIKLLNSKQEIQKVLSLVREVYYIKNVRVLVNHVKNMESSSLFKMVKLLKHYLQSGIVVLINIRKNNIAHIVISITKDLVECNRIYAIDLIQYIIRSVKNGKGGGRFDFAQLNINNVKNVSELVIQIQSLLNDIICNIKSIK
ncbi:alanyl-tRNA synthetase [Candidatus Blochmanniella floridana]|uniref:Alanine--tRNA ligase n=1 Tax=Blochmanniella floridana TaxID=203907 RepID=SYA_BLOFL|nr:RecName: Full=Alanine--tRNA ligase; AltName: Full=Alanyl-tRNA synthetase; Short=AlaRS [Candidatus Blochmannia floridanus]CAD83689.1 alanyl-tRNA synthetase [Candidatus Blochmannia floridanus]